MPAVSHCIRRGADAQAANVVFATGTIAELRSFIADLIHGWKDVIGELHFSDCCSTHCCHSDSKSNKSLFIDGHVENSIRAELFQQSHRAAKNAAESYVLPKQYSMWICG